MFRIKKISESDAVALLQEEEGHFFDVTRRDYRGEVLQKKCISFANADGGELIIGIHDRNEKVLSGGKFERWDGFANQEDANNAIADITRNIEPRLLDPHFDFLEIDGHEELGKVLSVAIDKSSDVHYTAGQNAYIRMGAQCLLILGDDITNLQLSKGAKSYENQLVVDYNVIQLTNSKELKNFIDSYLPKVDPKEFLMKQYLIIDSGTNQSAVYAGVLLYDDNPSAVLQKRCGLKITWYDTSEEVPEREHIKCQTTIEGPIHEQIIRGLQEMQRIINALPIMGTTGLERAKYPPAAIKEILVNALIHRDYNISDDVSVFIFNNRIEISSPGSLPAFITAENILTERFSRNPKLVRLLNKYPDRPNHDIGEGLNTAFQKMQDVRLKPPIINATKTKVTVILPHEPLASPEDQILEYLRNHNEINNKTAREITGIKSENKVKGCFYNLKGKGYIEMVPDKKGVKSAWRRVEINPPPFLNDNNKGQQQLGF
ncbi:MAG: putative DNA binding domain-containing protein [Candidatus Pacebacteria bacterium]|nr:putative DNA binding domain-containing protein [Candidatus Paceibacterota bacterium]